MKDGRRGYTTGVQRMMVECQTETEDDDDDGGIMPSRDEGRMVAMTCRKRKKTKQQQHKRNMSLLRSDMHREGRRGDDVHTHNKNITSCMVMDPR